MKEPNWKNCSEEEFWEYIAVHLSTRGINTVLVGGAVVAIYTDGLYQSGDLDLIPDDFDRPKIHEALSEIDFVKQGRHYRHPECDHLFVEFPAGPVAIGNDYKIKADERDVKGSVIRLLSPTDCVKDRLASYIHWGTRDCFDQAVLVAKEQKIHLRVLKQWCEQEGAIDIFNEFREAVANL